MSPAAALGCAHGSGISRTTAYRYFKNQAELLAAAHPEIHLASLLPAKPPADPAGDVIERFGLPEDDQDVLFGVGSQVCELRDRLQLEFVEDVAESMRVLGKGRKERTLSL